MPVVRELVNRISFQVDRGALKNAENAFGKMQTKGRGLIDFFGSLKTVALAAGAAIVGITLKGADSFSKLEKNQALTRFFTTSKEQAEDLQLAMARVRGDSQLISRLEAGKALTLFSRLNLKDLVGDFEKVAPILADISQADPSRDIVGVFEDLIGFVEGKDIGALRKFGGSVKDFAEKLEISDFSGKNLKTQSQAFSFLFEILQKNKGLFKELAKEQESTLTFQGRRIAKESEDFFANFGENTAEPMKELFKAIANTMNEINNSKAFWGFVKSSAEAIKEAFVETKRIISEINSKGMLGFFQSEGSGTDKKPAVSLPPVITEQRPDLLRTIVKDAPLAAARSVVDVNLKFQGSDIFQFTSESNRFVEDMVKKVVNTVKGSFEELKIEYGGVTSN